MHQSVEDPTYSKPLQSSPDIGIVGAGLTGFVFAIACRNAGLQFTIYESGPALWQHGSGIGLGANAMHALRLVDSKLAAMVNRISGQGEHQPVDFQYRYGQDLNASKAFDTFQHVSTEGMRTVDRTEFMNAMASFIPVDRINFCKHLTAINRLSTGKTQIAFRDGTTAVHDLVVGCDGIHSKVRVHVLGKDDPDAIPRFTGKVVHRATARISDVLEIFGEDKLDGIQVFIGHHGHIVLFATKNGTEVTITGTANRKSWDHEKWVIKTSAEDLKNDYLNWDDRLVQVLEKSGNTDVWALFDLPFGRTFVNGSVVLLGDAAHASTPFQGSGTSMAMEDAYFLARLLAHSSGKGQDALWAALDVYDKFRRPRSQKQVHTAMEAGWILDLESPMLGTDVEAIKKALSTRLNWIWGVDLEAQLNQAINSMHI